MPLHTVFVNSFLRDQGTSNSQLSNLSFIKTNLEGLWSENDSKFWAQAIISNTWCLAHMSALNEGGEEEEDLIPAELFPNTLPLAHPKWYVAFSQGCVHNLAIVGEEAIWPELFGTFPE